LVARGRLRELVGARENEALGNAGGRDNCLCTVSRRKVRSVGVAITYCAE